MNGIKLKNGQKFWRCIQLVLLILTVFLLFLGFVTSPKLYPLYYIMIWSIAVLLLVGVIVLGIVDIFRILLWTTVLNDDENKVEKS